MLRDPSLLISTTQPQLCKGRGDTIGQGDVCSFLLREMQQRESQARAHLTVPLPHHPSFSSMLNTKVEYAVEVAGYNVTMKSSISQETVCALLPLSNPPQYLSISKVL